MPVEAKPLFRPDVLRTHLAAFSLPGHVDAFRPKLAHWAELALVGQGQHASRNRKSCPISSPTSFASCSATPARQTAARATPFRARSTSRWKASSPTPFWATSAAGPSKFIVALEGKGPERPAGPPLCAAVDCRPSIRATATPSTCRAIGSSSPPSGRPGFTARGPTSKPTSGSTPKSLPTDDALLKRFVFLLGAARVVPETGRCHFYDLLAESERVGKDLTKEFYVRYAAHAARRLPAALPRQPRRAPA